MYLIKTTKDLNLILDMEKVSGKKIGFVPTMGALHFGHLSLLKQCKDENGFSVCSIFVNKKQFNEESDYLKYPKPIADDVLKLEQAGCDLLFIPENNEVYPDDFVATDINLHPFEDILEGKERPGHFKGVAQVVQRLFNMVKPDKAYFGQKDFQQTLVVKRMVRQLNLPVEIKIHPILRETNGLAMSSRNTRLTDEQFANAGFLFEALSKLKQNFGTIPEDELIRNCRNSILENEGTAIEYLEIVDAETLEKYDNKSLSSIPVVLAVVNYYGVRLLDNVLLK